MHLRLIPHMLLLCLLAGLGLGLRAETELQKADLLIRSRQFEEAEQLLQRALQANRRDAEALALMGELQLASHHPAKTVEYADAAILINPTKADYHVLRGNGFGNQAQQRMTLFALPLASAALKSFEKAVQLEPRNRGAVAALFNYYFRVPGIAGGSQKKALALAEQTILLDPSRGHYLKGLILEKQNDLGAAQAEYRLSLAADPSYSVACLHLGYVELGMKQVDFALEHFQRLVEIDPNNANSYDSLGDAWLAKGRLEEAIHAYRKALTLDPDFLASLDHLGKTLEKAGRREEAIQHYRQCVRAALPPGAVAEARARLKALGAEG